MSPVSPPPAILGEVDPRQWQLDGPLWQRVSLAAGRSLWREGQLSRQMAILLSGSLSVIVDGVTVGRVQAGELLGELSVFFAGGRTTATLKATRPCQLLVLSTDGLLELRRRRSPLYFKLLDQALRTVVERTSDCERNLERLRPGSFPPPRRPDPTIFGRIWKALKAGGPAGPCPPLMQLLAEHPGLRGSAPAVLEALAASFHPHPVTEGEIIILEGDPGDACFVLAAGQVDVLRQGEGERAALVASLPQGSLFGVNALVAPIPRTASCIATEPGWLYRMSRDAFWLLQGDARLAWHEAVLLTLATQFNRSDRSLRQALTPFDRVEGTRMTPALVTLGEKDALRLIANDPAA